MKTIKCKNCETLTKDLIKELEANRKMDALNRVLKAQIYKAQDTNAKQAELAVIIDNWYFEWKGSFPSVPHPLGMAKEELKSQLCNWLDKNGE